MSDTTSQATKIYRLIKTNNKHGVANYDLSKISLKYSSRISELRADGHNIYCERVRRNGKATGTFLYYLNDEPMEMIPEVKKHWWSR